MSASTGVIFFHANLLVKAADTGCLHQWVGLNLYPGVSKSAHSMGHSGELGGMSHVMVSSLIPSSFHLMWVFTAAWGCCLPHSVELVSLPRRESPSPAVLCCSEGTHAAPARRRRRSASRRVLRSSVQQQLSVGSLQAKAMELAAYPAGRQHGPSWPLQSKGSLVRV